MLIRSKNKQVLVNMDTIDCLIIEEFDNGNYSCNSNITYSISVDTKNKRYSIGKYLSEKNAIKILDMIQEKYLEMNYKKANVVYDYGKPFMEQPQFYIKPKVFQMPQDDEL